MIDPLAMPVFKPLWEAFPYLPGCFAAWRGMSLGEISASIYAAADGERRPSDAIVDCMAKHADEASATMLARRSSGIFPEQRRPVGESGTASTACLKWCRPCRSSALTVWPAAHQGP
ncbi:MAG: hypothetical protein ACLSAH_11250 [Bilophila wadsworthia]